VRSLLAALDPAMPGFRKGRERGANERLVWLKISQFGRIGGLKAGGMYQGGLGL